MLFEIDVDHAAIAAGAAAAADRDCYVGRHADRVAAVAAAAADRLSEDAVGTVARGEDLADIGDGDSAAAAVLPACCVGEAGDEVRPAFPAADADAAPKLAGSGSGRSSEKLLLPSSRSGGVAMALLLLKCCTACPRLRLG